MEHIRDVKPSGAGPHRQMQPWELWGQLTNTIRLRSNQDQVLWSITGIFIAANAVLLVALFQAGRASETPVPRIAIPLVGLSISVIQYFLQGRALGHINRLEELICRIEEALDFDPRYAVSADLNADEADRYLGGRKGRLFRRLFVLGTLFRTRTLTQRASLGAVLFWLGVAVLFVLDIIRAT